MPVRIEGLDHVAITVSDVERSIAFYRDVLGLEHRFADQWGASPAMLMAGGSGVALFAAERGHPAGAGHGMLHVAFRANRASFDAAGQALAARGISTELRDHGVAHSLYFADPDGYRLELTTYEV